MNRRGITLIEILVLIVMVAMVFSVVVGIQADRKDHNLNQSLKKAEKQIEKGIKSFADINIIIDGDTLLKTSAGTKPDRIIQEPETVTVTKTIKETIFVDVSKPIEKSSDNKGWGW